MTINSKDFSGLTDEVLFNRYMGGDVAAFDALLMRNKGLIYSLILRYVKKTNIADEVFQEVFLKVCKNKDLFRQAVSFKSWLVTICRNTCIDYTRKQFRTLKTESLDGFAEDGDKRNLSEVVASEDLNPGEVLDIQVETEWMQELLDQLPVDQRETFYMKVVMELTFEEIGESMKCSTNTAKSRYRYALASLRSLVRRQKMLGKAV